MRRHGIEYHTTKGAYWDVVVVLCVKVACVVSGVCASVLANDRLRLSAHFAWLA